MNNQLIKRFEPVCFIAILLIHLIPVFSVRYFLTVDGPAHLYNANLIRNYFTGSNEFINRYFYFNPNPEPNWSGHAIMSFLLCLFPAWLTEKIFIALYMISMAWTFRKLILALNPKAVISGYLVFPFIFNLPFSFGFFNFSLGLPVLFFGVYLWVKEDSFRLLNAALFFMVVLFSYFSHLFICLILLGITGCILLIQLFYNSQNWKLQIKRLQTKVWTFLICGLPVIILVAHFIQSKGTGGYKGKITSLPLAELLNSVVDTRSIICWIYDTEQAVSVFMSIILLLMVIAVFYFRMKARSGIFRPADYFLGFGLFLLVMFFIIPDSTMSGGFISVRILLLFHLLLIIWLGIQDFPPSIQVGFSAACLAVSLNLMAIHLKISLNLDKEVKEYLEIASFISEKSNILPLNYSDNWLHLNLSNYAGAEKNIIVLDNYEGNYPQFPLRWQENAYPYKLLGSFASSKRPCIYLDAYEKKSGLRVQYISRWEYSPDYMDSCSQITNRLLKENFDLIYQSTGKHAELFRRKGM